MIKIIFIRFFLSIIFFFLFTTAAVIIRLKNKIKLKKLETINSYRVYIKNPPVKNLILSQTYLSDK